MLPKSDIQRAKHLSETNIFPAEARAVAGRHGQVTVQGNASAADRAGRRRLLSLYQPHLNPWSLYARKRFRNYCFDE